VSIDESKAPGSNASILHHCIYSLQVCKLASFGKSLDTVIVLQIEAPDFGNVWIAALAGYNIGVL
jgi:hypothetical protein